MQSLAMVLLHAHAVELPGDDADGRRAGLVAMAVAADVLFKLDGRPG